MGPAKHPLTLALRRSMRELRIQGTLLQWESEAWAGHAGGPWRLALASVSDTREWLCARWRARAVAAVAARRGRFADAALGIDWPGAARALQVIAGSHTQWAAARSAMVGDSVTATRASHWRDVSRACPHCGHPEETVEHQLWQRPRWHAVRVAKAAAAGLGLQSLMCAHGPLTMHALLRTPCPFRAQAGAGTLSHPGQAFPERLALAGWTRGGLDGRGRLAPCFVWPRPRCVGAALWGRGRCTFWPCARGANCAAGRALRRHHGPCRLPREPAGCH